MISLSRLKEMVEEEMENKIKDLEEKLLRKEQECEELKDKLNCCFCNPYVELHDIEKQRKCVEVTECFRQQLDQLKKENEKAKQIILQAIEDFSLEYGTPQYDRLFKSVKALGIEVSDYE